MNDWYVGIFEDLPVKDLVLSSYLQNPAQVVVITSVQLLSKGEADSPR